MNVRSETTDGGARGRQVAMVQRGETTIGPVAVDGRTITLVARTSGIRLRGGRLAALGVRARPTHIEVLDEQGRRQVVRIRDLETTVIAAIVATGTVCALAARVLKRGSSR
jgi:hypothetical protein